MPSFIIVGYVWRILGRGDQKDPLPIREQPRKSPSWIGLIIGGSGPGKKILLFSRINQQPDVDKIYLYAKNPYEAKYQFLIDKRKSTGLKHFNDSKAFIEYPDDVDNIYKTVKVYSPNKKLKILIVYDDMIVDMLINKKKLYPVVAELFIRGRKLNISLVFITLFDFTVSKNIKLNFKHYFIKKIANKR